jgi:hypothetical protein
MKSLEKQKGISGYTNVEDQIKGMASANTILNNKKEETLQEIT